MSFGDAPPELIAMLQGEGRPDPRLKLTHAQQIERITDFFKLVYAGPPETLAPGDIVYHKYPQLSSERHEGSPQVFIRYLNSPFDGTDIAKTPEDIAHPFAARRYDCITGYVASMSRGTMMFAEQLTDSRTLTKTPPHVPAADQDEGTAH